jgi:predicted KAP-like P-loop ATPase
MAKGQEMILSTKKELINIFIDSITACEPKHLIEAVLLVTSILEVPS